MPELGQADGEVVAVDAADGSLRWSSPVPGDPLGGTAVVGDLVVTAPARHRPRSAERR